MRTYILVPILALGLLAGCHHEAHRAHPVHPATPAAPAAAAGTAAKAPATAKAAKAAAGDPGKAAAAAGSALPDKVALIAMDLSGHASGRADYHATYGKKTLDAHFAKSKAGVAHAWNSQLTKGAYREKGTIYQIKDGKCSGSTGAIGGMAMAMTTAIPFRFGGDPLLMLSAAIPGSALVKTGTDRVAGVQGTTYHFDTHESLGISQAHVAGTVTLDAAHRPLRSKGTVAVTGVGAKDFIPVKWTFATKDLDGDVAVPLPKACATAKAGMSALAGLPRPPGAGKAVTLGGMTSYPVKAKSEAVASFFEKALPAHGWKGVKARPHGVVAHQGKTRLQILLLPQGDTTMVMLQPK